VVFSTLFASCQFATAAPPMRSHMILDRYRGLRPTLTLIPPL
jgi:hypothetical protein